MNTRTTLVGSASTCALAIVAILAGCGSSTAHDHPAGSPCAAWWQGAGGRALAAVRTDLAQTVTPGGGLWQSQGATLSNDARAAALRPPPTSAGPYRAAMNDYATSGSDQATGDVRGALTARKRGNTQMAAVRAHQGGCM
jgi:hypothetical protein